MHFLLLLIIHFLSLRHENYTNRTEYIEKLLSYKDKDLIKVVSGLRRSGKSTLLELYRELLLKQGAGKRQIPFYIRLVRG